MLTISTFNIQNDYFKYSKEKTDIIYKYLRKNDIDILGLQEVYRTLDRDLSDYLCMKNYNCVGGYRLHFKYLFKRFNEKNPIITKKNIISYKTFYLPFLPSITKRVLTKVEIEDKNRIISIYNTHLEVRNLFVKKRQLKRILKIISKDKNPIILMGDFNLKTNKELFLDFIYKLKLLNIKHIDILDKTLKSSKYHRAIDHIFISDDFTLVEKKLVKNIPISDHYPVIIKVKDKR